MHVDSLQPPFSLIHRDAAAREIPWCAEHGTGVICYSPMQSGLLTDGFTADRVANFAQDDWRRRSPEFQEPNFSRNLALRDSLRPIAQSPHRNRFRVAWAGLMRGPALRQPLSVLARPSRWMAGSQPLVSS